MSKTKWSEGRREQEEAGFKDSRRGGDLTGEQVVSIEGDCGIHDSGRFLGCSFTWGGKRALAKPGLPITFHFAHRRHPYHPVFLYQLNRAIISFLCPRLFHLYLSPS